MAVLLISFLLLMGLGCPIAFCLLCSGTLYSPSLLSPVYAILISCSVGGKIRNLSPICPPPSHPMRSLPWPPKAISKICKLDDVQKPSLKDANT